MGSASTIPLMGQQPSFTTPGQYAQQGLGLQNLALGNALQSQQLKQAAIQAQQQAATVAGQQYTQQSFIRNKGDYDATLNDIQGNVPLAVSHQFIQDHLDNQRAQLQTTDAQNLQTKISNQATGAEAAALLGLPYEQRAAQLPGAIARLQKQGIDTSRYQNADPTDNALSYIIATSNYAGDLASWKDKLAQQDQRQAAAAKATQQAADEAQKAQQAKSAQSREDIARQYLTVNDQPSHDAWLANVAKTYPEVAPEYANIKTYGPGNAQIINGMALNAQQRSANAVSQQKLTDAEQKAADAANTTGIPKNEWEGAYMATDPSLPPKERADAALKRLDASKLAARPVTNITMSPASVAATSAPLSENGRNETFLKTLPAADQAYIKKIAEYDIAPLSGFAMSKPEGRAVMSNVATYNPSYDQKLYPARSALRASFTAGKDAANTASSNMVIGHLGTLDTAAEGLDNSAFKGYNTFANWLSRQSGSPITAPFRIARRAVASELGTALKGGVASEGEVKGWLDEIDASDSPASLRSEIGTIANIIGSRISALEKKYTDGMGMPPDKPLLSTGSQQILNRLSGSNPLSVTYQGHTFTFTDPAKMAQFKKDQGIQ
jgi:hypothetical protein